MNLPYQWTTITASPTTNSYSLLQVLRFGFERNPLSSHLLTTSTSANNVSTASATVFRPFITLALLVQQLSPDGFASTSALFSHFCLAVDVMESKVSQAVGSALDATCQ
jgi:hypothetical protein